MASTCPPDDALRRYLIGDYPDEQGAEIERHLSECAACEDTLAGFDDTKDQLLRHLPLAAASKSEDSSQSRPAWLERLKKGLPDSTPENRIIERDATDHPVNPFGELGSYELLGVLGCGGMGVVYRARHRQLGRSVAIKVVLPKLTSALNARDRFEQEIRILGGMDHPGIVMATDAGRVGPAAYLVMELIDGIDLARLVQQQGPLSVDQATELARQVAEALAAAHTATAVHRDVKPSNVMLDRDGRVKLLDFGLAHLSERANQHHETSLGRVLGTLDYMAPEQADGKPVQSSADLYGLGALLFYLLTGDPPHGSSPDRTLLEQLKNLTTADAPSLKSMRGDVPEELTGLVSQLLSRKPTDRPKDASQVAKSLSAWADAGSLASLTESIQPQYHDDDKDEVDRSLCALLGVEPTADTTGKASRNSASDGGVPKTDSRMFRNLAVFVSLAAGIAAILSGFTLLVDTPTGQIQIDSEIAGVQVELLDEKDRVTKLTIENREKTTELSVGKYRVRILEPHDKATLDKETLTLKKDETVVATIRQIENEKRPLTGETPSNAPPAADEVAKSTLTPKSQLESRANNLANQPLYEGQTRSHWLKRFEFEVHPEAKIAAGTALLALSSGSPAEQIVQRVEILGKIYEGAYGKKLQDVAFAHCANEQVPRAVWPDAAALPALRTTVARQLNGIPNDEIARKLIELVGNESPEKCSNALILLSYFKDHQSKAFADAIIDDLDSDSAPTAKLRQAILLMRAGLFRIASSEQKTRLVEDMEGAARESVATDIASSQPNANANQKAAATRNRHFERAWLNRVRKWKHMGIGIGVASYRDNLRIRGIDAELVSQVVLYDALNNNSAYRKHFYRHWATDQYPFDDAGSKQNREYSFPLWENWVSVANTWLAENDTPENLDKVNRILKTYRLVLPTRLESDEWDTQETAKLLKKHLKAHYTGAEEERSGNVDAHDLLTNLILCGEPIPDFVVAAPPADPKIRERLAEFSKTVNSRLSLNEYSRRVATAKGLIQVAPFHTVKCIMTATHCPTYVDGSRVGLIRFIKDASSTKTKVNTGHVPPMNPLLLLAITSELSKEYGAQISYRELKSDTKMFHRHLGDALHCPTVVGTVAEHWLRKMYANASEEKKMEIQVLAPMAKNFVTGD